MTINDYLKYHPTFFKDYMYVIGSMGKDPNKHQFRFNFEYNFYFKSFTRDFLTRYGDWEIQVIEEDKKNKMFNFLFDRDFL